MSVPNRFYDLRLEERNLAARTNFGFANVRTAALTERGLIRYLYLMWTFRSYLSSGAALRLQIGDTGLLLGGRACLMRMSRQESLLAEDEERLLALLAVGYRRPPEIDLRRHVEAASAYWQRGEKALANLAFCTLTCLTPVTRRLYRGYSLQNTASTTGWPPWLS